VDVESSAHIGTGAGPGAVTVSPIQITRYNDTTSPIVSLQAAQGTVIPTATIMLLPHYESRPRTEYGLTITLTDVIVNQVTSDATTQNNIPLEKLSLSFGKIKWEYSVRQADGSAGPSIITTYDVAQRQVDGNSGFYPTFVNFAPGASRLHFEDETEFSSLALQLTNSATGQPGTGAGSGTLAISPLSLVVHVFEDTFGEFGSALRGTSVPLVTAHFIASGQESNHVERLVYQMTQAQVVSVAIDTTPSGMLQETLGFDFARIKWQAQSPNGGGEVVAEWPPVQTAHH
jgi:type VI protein secretion system component Hcp